MKTHLNKYKKSIDGNFSEYIKLEYFTEASKKFFNLNTIHAEGNSISDISFNKSGYMIKPMLRNNFLLDKKKNLLTCNGNAKVSDIHNFLITNNRYCPFFPSYPGVSIGACVANGVHGVSSKKGIFNDNVIEIKIYNPNFGLSILNKKKNKALFELTKNGFGLTGIIIEIKFKVFNLRNPSFEIKFSNSYDLYKCYKFLKKSKSIYNQNSFYIDYNKKDLFVGKIITATKLYKKSKKLNKLKLNKLPKLRLGLFNFEIIKLILFKFFFIYEKFKYRVLNNLDINKLIFNSNFNTIYFLFQSKKFIEHQNIIPEKKVKNYLIDFKKIILKYKPNITLLHLKVFQNRGLGFEFTDKGLALAVHIIRDNNFIKFYNEMLKLDLKYNCKINLYKNSLITKKNVKLFYPIYYKKFVKNIKFINKKFKFKNNIL